MKTIKDCFVAWMCGFSIGVWFGFYDLMGHVYYSVNSGLRSGMLLAAVFAIVALWWNLIGKDK